MSWCLSSLVEMCHDALRFMSTKLGGFSALRHVWMYNWLIKCQIQSKGQFASWNIYAWLALCKNWMLNVQNKNVNFILHYAKKTEWYKLSSCIFLFHYCTNLKNERPLTLIWMNVGWISLTSVNIWMKVGWWLHYLR